jgi:hypothetical protein
MNATITRLLLELARAGYIKDAIRQHITGTIIEGPEHYHMTLELYSQDHPDVVNALHTDHKDNGKPHPESPADAIMWACGLLEPLGFEIVSTMNVPAVDVARDHGQMVVVFARWMIRDPAPIDQPSVPMRIPPECTYRGALGQCNAFDCPVHGHP